MCVDLTVRDLARLSWTRIGVVPNALVQEIIGEIGASGAPDARSNASIDPRRPDPRHVPPPHGGPSLSSSAVPRSHPTATDAHSGTQCCSQSIDPPQDRREQLPGHGHLRQLERDGLRVADDLGPDLDQLLPQRR